ncbi:MAG: chemotaxis protein CheB [Thiopseudomonas sp.]|nr:chemotaxis protein CheB [Gammaproteobacteria bacterium]
MAMRVAVLADSHLQRRILREFLGSHGHEVVLNADPARLTPAELGDCTPDAWLVDLLRMDAHQEALLEHLYGQDAPVLVGEGEAPQAHSDDYARWERSLEKKLDALDRKKGQPAQAVPASAPAPAPRVDKVSADNNGPAEQLWLLAASMGGPVAVKEFLDALPVGLPIGFLYAQHIDCSFEKQLPSAVGRHSRWPVRLARHDDFVRTGEVVVVPVNQELNFASGGRMQCMERPWSGSYSPSIEQMMLNLAAEFGRCSGTIVFSGMGEDGSRACAHVAGQGMKIWVQDSQSSTCPSMPDSVRQTGFSSYSGTPRELARAMLNHTHTLRLAQPAPSRQAENIHV